MGRYCYNWEAKGGHRGANFNLIAGHRSVRGPAPRRDNVLRKRVNTSLDHLRSLIPFTTTTKRDMASLLEQTVEYINTMHTVLNEDKPDCLSKIYTLYQKKIEEYDLFRRASTPKASKRKISSSNSSGLTPTSSCNGIVAQHQSPGMFPAYRGNCNASQNLCSDESNAKRHCAGHAGWDQDILQRAMATPIGSSAQNWQPQQLIIDPMTDANNNVVHSFSSVPFGSENRLEKMIPNCYLFGQSPLPIQYQIASRPNEQPSPFPSGSYHPFTKFCGGLSSTTSPIENSFQGEMMPNSICREDSAIRNNQSDPFKGRRGQTSFTISNLISGDDEQNSEIPMNNPWNQPSNVHATSMVSFNPLLQRNDNPTHSLLAPMDMNESPTIDARSSSRRCMGVDKLLEKVSGRDQGFTQNSADTGVLLKSSVSSMLNEVTGMNAADYPKVFGSTERRMTPILSFARDPGHSFGTKNSGISAALSLALGRSSSAPVSSGSEYVKILTPSTCSTPSEKFCDESITTENFRTITPTSISQANQELPTEAANETVPKISEGSMTESKDSKTEEKLNEAGQTKGGD